MKVFELRGACLCTWFGNELDDCLFSQIADMAGNQTGVIKVQWGRMKGRAVLVDSVWNGVKGLGDDPQRHFIKIRASSSRVMESC